MCSSDLVNSAQVPVGEKFQKTIAVLAAAQASSEGDPTGAWPEPSRTAELGRICGPKPTTALRFPSKKTIGQRRVWRALRDWMRSGDEQPLVLPGLSPADLSHTSSGPEMARVLTVVREVAVCRRQVQSREERRWDDAVKDNSGSDGETTDVDDGDVECDERQRASLPLPIMDAFVDGACSSAEDSPGAEPQPVEKQEEMKCLLHALNNILIGSKCSRRATSAEFEVAADMLTAANAALLQDSGAGKRHGCDGGKWTIEVAQQWLDACMPCCRIMHSKGAVGDAEVVLGVIAGGGCHFACYHRCAVGARWELADSLREAPTLTTAKVALKKLDGHGWVLHMVHKCKNFLPPDVCNICGRSVKVAGTGAQVCSELGLHCLSNRRHLAAFP